MTIQPGAMGYVQSFGSSPMDVAYPHIEDRDPTEQDLRFSIGKRWINRVANTEWTLTSFSSVAGTLTANWSQGGNEEATTSSFGIVQLATLAELQTGTAPAGAYVPTSNDVATVIAGIVVGAVPPAQEGQAGIAELATQAETDAGVDDLRIVTPLKLANFVASGGFPGVFTDLTATGTISFTGATGTGYAITAASASSIGTTGAGIDLTLSSAAGRVVVNGEEAAADAVRILSAAGGLDVNVALQMNLDSSQASATAIRLVTSNAGGGIDVDSGTGGIAIDSTGAISIDGAAASNLTVTGAGIDLTLASVGGSVLVSSTENAALAIFLHANGGTSETIQLRADQGTSATSVQLLSDVGGVTITAGAANADAINLTTTNASGGIDIDSGTGGIIADTTGSAVITSTANSSASIFLHANGGVSETIRLHADQGTGVASLDLLSDVGGITLTAGLGTADAINLVTSNAAGGIDVDAGTGGIDILTTGALSIDSAGTTNLTTTGAFALTVNSTAGQLTLQSGQAAADAVRINASNAAGGIDVDSGTGGITLDTTGAMSLDSAATSNYTVTGAGADLNLLSVGGSVLVDSTENAALAIRLHANGGTSETIQIHSDQGTGVASIGLLSDVGGITLTSTGLASADAINLEAAAGGIDVDAALQINITSSQNAVDAIRILASAGGIDIDAVGAATEDINITNTGGSVVITATENVTDAIVITASGAASAFQVDAGTGSFRIGTGIVVAVTSVDSAASPYTVLGTDYFISVDTSGGAVTVTLPAATALAGRTFVIRDTGGAAAVNNITIGGGGTNLVGGGAAAATKVLSAAYSGATVYSNGATWNYAYVA